MLQKQKINKYKRRWIKQNLIKHHASVFGEMIMWNDNYGGDRNKNVQMIAQREKGTCLLLAV